ncbi:uncharacterized protein LOC117117308 [Anneissia japonica]|uniref:uncharacterized protein LOC117117308 n=1 Tax=Anneissia japonica TaxID=1529436 RepID=UPI0014259CA8|nr:uncharacterized protein LOC117117308 [Anneissia japonica]
MSLRYCANVALERLVKSGGGKLIWCSPTLKSGGRVPLSPPIDAHDSSCIDAVDPILHTFLSQLSLNLLKESTDRCFRGHYFKRFTYQCARIDQYDYSVSHVDAQNTGTQQLVYQAWRCVDLQAQVTRYNEMKVRKLICFLLGAVSVELIHFIAGNWFIVRDQTRVRQPR